MNVPGVTVSLAKAAARQGHELQHYSAQGARVVACLVVVKRAPPRAASGAAPIVEANAGADGDASKVVVAPDYSDMETDRRPRVLLVSVKKNLRMYTLPRGGVDKDEAEDYGRAALRETWEEAGVLCRPREVASACQVPRDSASDVDSLAETLGRVSLEPPNSAGAAAEPVFAASAGTVTQLGAPVLLPIRKAAHARRLPNQGAFPYTEVHFFEAAYGAEAGSAAAGASGAPPDAWPESGRRDRMWVHAGRAVRLLERSGRPEMVAAVKCSSVWNDSKKRKKRGENGRSAQKKAREVQTGDARHHLNEQRPIEDPLLIEAQHQDLKVDADELDGTDKHEPY